MNPYYEMLKSAHGAGLAPQEQSVGDVYRSVLYQRGYGLGQYYNYSDRHGLGFIDGLASLVRFAMPAMKEGLKYLGNQAVSTVANIAHDAIAGTNMKDSAKHHVAEVARDVFAKAPAAILSNMVIADKTRGIKRKASSQQSAGKLVASARAKVLKKHRKHSRVFGKGLYLEYPALEKLQ